jgi:hypothetical protein
MQRLCPFLTASLFLVSALAPAADAGRVAGVGLQDAAGTARIEKQDKIDEPLPDKRPDIAEMIAKLDADVAKNTPTGDNDAVADIDKLYQEFPKCGPKDRASVVKALSKCFEAKRKEAEEGVPNNKMHIAAARALGDMGPESTKPLVGWVGHKNFRKDLVLQRYLLLSLGKTRDKDGLKTLVVNLENKDASIVSAAAEAMGDFAESDQATRKEVFDALLKPLMSAKSQADVVSTDQIAKDRFDIIKAAIITSLGKLAKHTEQDPDEWQRWWNKNKRADWDAPQ